MSSRSWLAALSDVNEKVQGHVDQLASYKRSVIFQDEPLASATSDLSTFDRETDRNQVRPPHRVAANTVQPIVEISPPDSVERRTASWPGMAAEIVQATRSDRIGMRLANASGSTLSRRPNGRSGTRTQRMFRSWAAATS
jgi:hypothetical protein